MSSVENETQTSSKVFILASKEISFMQRLTSDNGLSAKLQEQKLGYIPYLTLSQYKPDEQTFGSEASLSYQMSPFSTQMLDSSSAPIPPDGLQDNNNNSNVAQENDNSDEDSSDCVLELSASAMGGGNCLQLHEGYWAKDSFNTRIYTGVKRAGGVKDVSYTFFVSEKMIASVQWQIEKNNSEKSVKVSIDGSGLPSDIHNVKLRASSHGNEVQESQPVVIKKGVKDNTIFLKITDSELQKNFSYLNFYITNCDLDFTRLKEHPIVSLPTTESLQKLSKDSIVVSITSR